MKTNLMFTFRSINAVATLYLFVAFIVALGVIPFVKFDTCPGATPGNALPVFWAIVFYEFIIGTILLFIAYHFTGKSKPLSVFFAVIATLAFITTLAFIDAAFAYWSHGIAMHVATVLLLCCSLANLLTVILIIRAIILFSRQE
jgi:peptidoglycan/LPS O-acetylase OafA/YrhL